VHSGWPPIGATATAAIKANRTETGMIGRRASTAKNQMVAATPMTISCTHPRPRSTDLSSGSNR